MDIQPNIAEQFTFHRGLPMGTFNEKLGNLFRADSVNSPYQAHPTYLTPDELTFVRAAIEEVIKAPLKANELIPLSTKTPEGAAFIKYRLVERTAKVGYIGDHTNDIPVAALGKSTFYSEFQYIATSFNVSLLDRHRSGFAGVNLDLELVNACLEAIQKEQNDIAFFGDPTRNLTGWLTNQYVPKYIVAGADANAKKWENKTGRQMLDDLNGAKNLLLKNTKGSILPDTLAMGIDSYALFSETPFAPNSETTALDYFQERNRGIRIVEADELDGKIDEETGKTTGFNGVSGFVFYNNKEKYFRQEIPIMYNSEGPLQEGLTWKTYFYSKIGGTVITSPLSMVFGIGI